MSLAIKHPISGTDLQVANNDFPNKMDWDEATSFCQNIGNGWRLPNIEELEAMCYQLHWNGKGDFKDGWYWSSSETSADYAWSLFLDADGGSYLSSDYINEGLDNYGSSKDNKFYVRAVRDSI